MENNDLETISDLLPLEKLKLLNLAGNHINKFGHEVYQKIFPFLEEIHLNSNSISNLKDLELHRMPTLKRLFLQNNDITSIKGMYIKCLCSSYNLHGIQVMLPNIQCITEQMKIKNSI